MKTEQQHIKISPWTFLLFILVGGIPLRAISYRGARLFWPWSRA